ncbi:hypothetical protein K432DRAFT_158261 [Lepidopterella palustris CBS 459.81]|uniref:Uncharacterized protein n=1 Tax=Lepidopterella palustris CBS 459.81 TaxID=1314670 RepID=A0A8E2JB34_9PEZI|nr:hypothetical protein K432DRAFT_158261 [Lepidopterella palustris CBS 459.81]
MRDLIQLPFNVLQAVICHLPSANLAIRQSAIHQPAIYQPAILPICHSANLPFCQSAILPFCHPAILPSCHLPICHLPSAICRLPSAISTSFWISRHRFSSSYVMDSLPRHVHPPAPINNAANLLAVLQRSAHRQSAATSIALSVLVLRLRLRGCQTGPRRSGVCGSNMTISVQQLQRRVMTRD